MLFKIYLLMTAVFIAIFLYLFSLNPQTISFKLSEKLLLEDFHFIPFLFLVFVMGFLANSVLVFPKSIRGVFCKVKHSRDNRKEGNSDKLLSRAKKSILLENGKEAEECLKKCIAIKSKLPEPYVLLMGQYLKAGNHDKAFALMDSMPPEIEKNLEILIPKVKVLMAKGSFERAADIISTIDGYEKDVDAQALLRNLFMRSEQWGRASKLQEKIVKEMQKVDRKNAEAVSVRINFELANELLKNKKLDEAIRKFTELTKKHDLFAPPYVNLGKLHWEAGNKALAVQTWKTGYKKTENMIFVFMLEELYLKEEEPEEIIKIYNDLILDDSESAELKLFLGKLYLRLEMRAQALEWLKKAEAGGLNSPYVARLTGEVLFRNGEFESAAEKFKESFGSSQRKTVVPFQCQSCSTASDNWKDTCPNCNEWNTLKVAVS